MKTALILTLVLLAGAAFGQTEVSVLVSSHATAVERLASAELAGHLRLLYPSARFTVGKRATRGATVLLGTAASFPELAAQLNRQKPEVPLRIELSAGDAIEVRNGGRHRVDANNANTLPVHGKSLDIELRPLDAAASVSRLVLTTAGAQ